MSARSDTDGARHLFALDKRSPGFNPLDFRPGRRLEGELGDKRLLRGFVDAKGVLRAALVADREFKAYEMMRLVDGEWRKARALTADTVSSPVGLSADGASMLLQSDAGSDRVGLVRFALDGSGADETVLSVPGADVVLPVIRLRDRAVLGGYIYRTGVARLHYLDGDPRLPKAVSASLPDARIAVVDWSRDGSRLVLDVHVETGPNAYYLYDAKKQQVEKLFDARPALARVAAVGSVALAVPGGSGVSGEAYLSLPAGARRFPLVVMPAATGERRSFDPTLQLFVQAGFAVLRIGEDVDIAAAADVAAAKFPVDRDRVALFGAGSGAHAALMALAQSPARYR